MAALCHLLTEGGRQGMGELGSPGWGRRTDRVGNCLGSSLFVGSFPSTRIFGDKCGHLAWSCWGLFSFISRGSLGRKQTSGGKGGGEHALCPSAC